MKILVTGGCGYVGTLLVYELLKNGHDVKVIDTQWFGNYLSKHKRLINIKKDFRNIIPGDLKGVDKIIHLANIANDPGVELNQTLSWEVNVLGLEKLLRISKAEGVKQFIYASSGSVYGIKKEKKVTEELSLLPISTYNKTKMIAERVITSYSDRNFKSHIIRPATVCGVSPRMRLDVSVNLLTHQAMKYKQITLFGGKQIRPNIHILDLVNVFIHFVKKPYLKNGFYNAGFENISLLNLAKKIKKKTKCKINIKKIVDLRSYRLNSQKLLNTNFKPRYGVSYAINEIINAYKQGELIERKNCYTVSWMKKNKLDKAK